jgi:hypothetical protein
MYMPYHCIVLKEKMIKKRSARIDYLIIGTYKTSFLVGFLCKKIFLIVILDKERSLNKPELVFSFVELSTRISMEVFGSVVVTKENKTR